MTSFFNRCGLISDDSGNLLSRNVSVSPIFTEMYWSDEMRLDIFGWKAAKPGCRRENNIKMGPERIVYEVTKW
jgi:hypothetical protein